MADVPWRPVATGQGDEVGVAVEGRIVLARSGDVVCAVARPQVLASGDRIWQRLRLRADDVYRNGIALASVEQDEQRVVARFDDGSEVAAELLVQPTASSPRCGGNCCLPSSRVMPAMWPGASWRTWPNCPGRPAICCGTGSRSACRTRRRPRGSLVLMVAATERLTTRDMNANPHEEIGLAQDESARMVPHHEPVFPDGDAPTTSATYPSFAAKHINCS